MSRCVGGGQIVRGLEEGSYVNDVHGEAATTILHPLNGNEQSSSMDIGVQGGYRERVWKIHSPLMMHTPAGQAAGEALAAEGATAE